MRLSEVMESLQELAPLGLAEAWDNVGLLVGDPSSEVQRALFAIDMTAEVFAEARQKKCELLVAYHPPLFSPLKRVTSESLIFEAISHRIAIYAPHTALDVARGGTNDVLADIAGIGTERSALKAAEQKDAEYKLVTFVPEDALEKVMSALFEAGAGHIGDYSSCSFRAPGRGTFFGATGTNPKVGRAGHREDAPELRLETVVPIARVDAVVAALRGAHPYEEPAFDLVRLAAPPSPEHPGMGRIGNVDPIDRAALFEKIKKGLGVDKLLVAGKTDGKATRVAVAAGSCGDMWREGVSKRADIYLTGEMRHHEVLAASRHMTVVCALHSNSERAAMGIFGSRVKEKTPALDVVVSESDRDPFQIR